MKCDAESRFCNACDEFFRCLGGIEVNCPLEQMRIRARKKQQFMPGQKFRLKLRVPCSTQLTERSVVCSILECYEKFCLMSTGKYRFCVFYDELHDGAHIIA